MKTYFISGELYDNYEDFNYIAPFSRLVSASSAIVAFDEVVIEMNSGGVAVLIKDIKVVE